MKKQLRILVTFCTDLYWLDVAKSLTDQGITITHLISRPPEVQAQAKEVLPKTVVIDQDTLEYPYLIEQLNKDNPVLLSQELLDTLKSAELEFLAITDRLAFFPLTVKRRRAIFQELVTYWYHFLRTERLDGIFFTDAPHVGFDTVLFAVAEQLKIPMVSIRRPFIKDRMLLVRDYRAHLPKVSTGFMATNNKSEIEKAVGKELIEDVFSENFWQKKDAQYNKIIHTKEIPFFNTVKKLNPLKVVDYITGLFKKSKYGGFNYNNGQLVLVEKLCGLYHRYHNHRLHQYYDNLSSSFKTPKKFIYFPLHLQPERSTTPEGGVFENQLLALKILSRTIPNDWKIVIKEHPRQFGKFDFQKHPYRNKRYYDSILKIPKTILAPMSLAQEKLVAKAQATATITGTGGWESLKVNKPAIVFGNAWYSPCRSCYLVQSEKEAVKALDEISGSTPKQVVLDVLRFLAVYRNRLIIASNAREFALQSDRPYETLVQNMAMKVCQELVKAQ